MPRLLPLYLLLFGALALPCSSCGSDAEPEPPTVDDTGPLPDIPPTPRENAAGIPGAITVALDSPVRWLTASKDGSLWILAKDGSLSLLEGEATTSVATFQASTETIEIVHPPPAVMGSGVVVVAQAVLDSVDCRDNGSVTWIDPTTGKVTTRELQEAPAFDFSVTAEGLALLPLIEYDWKLYNDPPICLKSQPDSIKLAALDKEIGLLWTINLERPCGAPTLAADGKTGFYSDRYRTLVAFDHSAWGAILWKTPLSDEGTVQLSNPALGADGTLYVNVGKRLVAVNGTTGAIAWDVAVETADNLAAEPLVGESGQILALGSLPGKSQDARIWAVFQYDSTGALIDVVDAGKTHLHQAKFTLGGFSVLGNGDWISTTPFNELIVWRKDISVSSFAGFDPLVPPVVLPDGRLAAAWGDDGRLLLAGISNYGLAPSSWPRIGGSNSQDGSSP